MSYETLSRELYPLGSETKTLQSPKTEACLQARNIVLLTSALSSHSLHVHVPDDMDACYREMCPTNWMPQVSTSCPITHIADLHPISPFSQCTIKANRRILITTSVIEPRPAFRQKRQTTLSRAMYCMLSLWDYDITRCALSP